jgi:triphosphoribosyl-dephospho-CoA synthetase
MSTAEALCFRARRHVAKVRLGTNDRVLQNRSISAGTVAELIQATGS